MSDRRPLSEAQIELNGSESAGTVDAVAQDFEALIVILNRQLELVPTSDEQTRTHIAQAKAAAERGALLSRSLLERTNSKT
jgi:hypothetical protein